MFWPEGGEPWVAGVAMLLFAVDDVHGQAAGWISSRNTLLSACFGFLASPSTTGGGSEMAALFGTSVTQ